MHQWPTLQDALDEMRTDAGAADGDDAHPLVWVIAEALAQLGAATECARVLPDDVAGEVEVLRHPVAHGREVFAERQRHDVLGCTNKDRPVAHAGMPLNVL